MLTPHFSGDVRLYANDKGHIEGRYVDFFHAGTIWELAIYANGVKHGEVKTFYVNGSVRTNYLALRGRNIRDLINDPASNEEKMILTLEHGVRWL